MWAPDSVFDLRQGSACRWSASLAPHGPKNCCGSSGSNSAERRSCPRGPRCGGAICVFRGPARHPGGRAHLGPDAGGARPPAHVGDLGRAEAGQAVAGTAEELPAAPASADADVPREVPGVPAEGREQGPLGAAAGHHAGPDAEPAKPVGACEAEGQEAGALRARPRGLDVLGPLSEGRSDHQGTLAGLS
jgi:hypothetical protein